MKTWTERLNTKGINGIKPSPRSFSDVVEGQSMLVPTARQVDDFIRTIPQGVHLDVRTLRRELARCHGAEVTCPVTIGYHLRTVAEAANEDVERGAGLRDITPFWRVLDKTTPTTGRLSFGQAFGAAQRRREGLPE
ncbi:hypothetical protein [Aminobacter sp. Piv2-1]|uniref:hypothetical protein n=1 Tax=Aminobacter sp. Piv2-1 TaxID=3031122 RepID=UPI003097CE2A